MHQQYIFSAGSELRKLKNSDAAFEPSKELLDCAFREFENGEEQENLAKNAS